MSNLIIFLRSTTSLAPPADSYAVGGNSPKVVADFANEYYRVGGSDSDFPTMFSGYTTRSDLATQNDSDGYIKWCPHNLLPQSEQLNTTPWSASLTTVTENTTTAPDGNSTADTLDEGSSTGYHNRRNTSMSVLAGRTVTLAAYFKYIDMQYVAISAASSGVPTGGTIFDIQNGTIGANIAGTGYTVNSSSITDVGSGWYLCVTNVTTPSGINTFSIAPCINTSGLIYGAQSYTGTNRTVYVWGAHGFRSDLGGMVDVPTDMRAAAGANFATYVPTTTAAKYLQRRGNHVYNGSSWVNKGIQIETEARTNLAIYSNTLSSWTTSAGETVTQDATGPDGVANSAWTFATNGGTAYARHPEITAMDGNTITISMWFKDVNLTASDYIYLRNVSNTDGGAVWIDKDGTIVNTTGTSSSSTVTNYGGGWFRVSHTCTVGAVVNNFVDIGVDTSSYNFTARTSGLSFIAYGMQCEAGSTPSSYIPTTSGAIVSRAADSLQIPAANMAASQTALSVAMEATVTYPGTAVGGQTALFTWYNSSTEFVDLTIAATDNLYFRNLVASGTDAQKATGNNIVDFGVNQSFKGAGRFSSSAVNVAYNGTAATANSGSYTGAVLTSSNVIFGTSGTGTQQMEGMSIGLFRQWDVDLGDSGIATAST